MITDTLQVVADVPIWASFITAVTAYTATGYYRSRFTRAGRNRRLDKQWAKEDKAVDAALQAVKEAYLLKLDVKARKIAAKTARRKESAHRWGEEVAEVLMDLPALTLTNDDGALLVGWAARSLDTRKWLLGIDVPAVRPHAKRLIQETKEKAYSLRDAANARRNDWNYDSPIRQQARDAETLLSDIGKVPALTPQCEHITVRALRLHLPHAFHACQDCASSRSLTGNVTQLRPMLEEAPPVRTVKDVAKGEAERAKRDAYTAERIMLQEEARKAAKAAALRDIEKARKQRQQRSTITPRGDRPMSSVAFDVTRDGLRSRGFAVPDRQGFIDIRDPETGEHLGTIKPTGNGGYSVHNVDPGLVRIVSNEDGTTTEIRTHGTGSLGKEVS